MKVSKAEQRILELVGQGHSSREIAERLNISAHTVETHRKSLLLKFNAKNSVELVMKAVQEKVLGIY